MKTVNKYNIFKILLILLCSIFLFTACNGEADGGTVSSGKDDEEQLKSEQRTCWQGSLLKSFYNGIGAQTVTVYNSLTTENNLLNVVILVFAIWMGFQILKHVATPSPESIGEFWTKIIRKAFLCTICGLLASSTMHINYVINNFIFPVYLTLLEFASRILDIMGQDPDASVSAIAIQSNDGVMCEVYDHSINDTTCQISNTEQMKADGGEFPEAPANMMNCMACAMANRLDVGYNIAIKVICLPGIVPTLVGLYLIVCFAIAKYGFAFYLLDSIFRMNMILIILPFLIMFYAFEQTRKWTVKGFQVIIHSAAIMLCLTIIVSMTVLAMQKMLTDPNMGMEFGNDEEYQSFGIVSMAMVFMGFLIIKVSGMAVTLAGTITGYSGKANLQKKIQQLVATIAKTAFHLISMGSGKAITTAIDTIQKLKELYEKYKKMKQKVQKVRAKMQKFAGR